MIPRRRRDVTGHWKIVFRSSAVLIIEGFSVSLISLFAILLPVIGLFKPCLWRSTSDVQSIAQAVFRLTPLDIPQMQLSGMRWPLGCLSACTDRLLVAVVVYSIFVAAQQEDQGTLDGNTTMPETATSQHSLTSRLLWLLPRLAYRVLALVAYYIPAQVFSILGTSFSITLSFSSLLVIMLAFGTIVWAFVRYRYLNIYSRLPQERHRTEQKLDMLLYPSNMPSSFDKPGFSSYLDEFFSGIKVFGYLEKAVVHELTRHVQTRKLIAGDTMLLSEEKGFCIVRVVVWCYILRSI